MLIEDRLSSPPPECSPEQYTTYIQVDEKLKKDDGTKQFKGVRYIEENPNVEQVEIAIVSCIHEQIHRISETLKETVVALVPHDFSQGLNA